MTGPKLNENVLALAEGQRATKAVARYVKGSATKVRVVLDLIRGLPVQRADEVLQFADRGAAADVRKVLASAVANAVHNDAQDVEELFVLAAFADEGPTLKRFRPRARGRASRIRKRTSHITVVVARMSDDRLEVLANREASSAAARRRPGLSARSRAERVERSRRRAEGLREGSAPEEATVTDEGVDVDEVATTSDLSEIAFDESGEATEAAEAIDVVEVDVDAETAADAPAGAVLAPEDGSVPEGYPIKGNTNSMKYHEPGGRYYDVTIAELYFDTPASAEAAGYEPVAAPAAAAPVEETEPAEASSDDEAGAESTEEN
jgi:large subunit ribosomal protein L22